jgi:thiol-disulfide isomerase/thioredoxin
MKRCPKCKDNKVVIFDSDNDWCPKCNEQFPTVAEEEDACETGCKHFHGGEIAHHPDCIFYPESRTKMYDDLVKEHNRFGHDIKRVIVEINAEILKHIDAPNLGKKGCTKRLNQLLVNDYTKEPEELDIVTEITVLREALNDMYFAYVNKDEEFPHDFEIFAVDKAEKLLKIHNKLKDNRKQYEEDTIKELSKAYEDIANLRMAVDKLKGDLSDANQREYNLTLKQLKATMIYKTLLESIGDPQLDIVDDLELDIKDWMEMIYKLLNGADKEEAFGCFECSPENRDWKCKFCQIWED